MHHSLKHIAIGAFSLKQKMMNSQASGIAQHRKVHRILHDLVYANDAFLNSLAKAVQNNFIRCLQWTADGRCLCVNKAQALFEFEQFLCLKRQKGSLECYTKLISRLLENQFQLTSYCYGFPNQVRNESYDEKEYYRYVLGFISSG